MLLLSCSRLEIARFCLRQASVLLKKIDISPGHVINQSNQDVCDETMQAVILKVCPVKSVGEVVAGNYGADEQYRPTPQSSEQFRNQFKFTTTTATGRLRQMNPWNLKRRVADWAARNLELHMSQGSCKRYWLTFIRAKLTARCLLLLILSVQV